MTLNSRAGILTSNSKIEREAVKYAWWYETHESDVLTPFKIDTELGEEHAHVTSIMVYMLLW